MIESILITGSSGFIGGNLVKYLTSHYKVDILSLRYSDNQIIEINSDIVIHLAGIAHDIQNDKNLNTYIEGNFLLTKQVYDSFLKSSAKKFIFLSSVKAVADKTDVILTEDIESPSPQTNYGISKLMAEQYIRLRGEEAGKKYYILRPCMVYGEGNKGNLNLLYNYILRGVPYPLGLFDNKRSFLSVENLCFIIHQLLEKEGIASGVYNVADDIPISTNELVKLIGTALNKKVIILSIPQFIVLFFVKIFDLFNILLTTERLEKMTSSFVVDNSKIKTVLKIALPIDSKEGIIKTLKSFKTVNFDD